MVFITFYGIICDTFCKFSWEVFPDAITFGIKLTHVMLKGHIVYRSKKDMAIGWENLLYGLE